MKKSEYLKKQILEIDDEAFAEIADAVTDRAIETEEVIESGLVTIGDDSDDVQEAIKNWGKFNGISTGWKNVDALTYGWLPGELIIMGGEPAVGKSAFICAMAVNLARGDHLTTIVSMELTRKQVQIRVAKNAGESWVEEVGSMIILQEKQMIRRKDFVEIIAKAKEGGSNIVIVDYLQMLKDDTQNEHREIARIVRELKLLALENEMTIIAISSLNRGRDAENGLQPEDLFGSSSIEFYADQIIFLERVKDEFGYITVKVAKNRSNPCNPKTKNFLTFDGSKFEDSFGPGEDIDEEVEEAALTIFDQPGTKTA